MRRTYRLIVPAVAVCVSIAGAACGGDGDGGSEAWIKAADASCHRLQTTVGGQPPEDVADAAANAKFWGALASGARVNLSEIDALRVPNGDEAEIAAIVEGMGATMTQLEVAVESYEASDVTKAKAELEEFFELNEGTVALFTGYGSKVCGEA